MSTTENESWWTFTEGRWEDNTPDESEIDHIITDPPYDDRTHEGALYDAGDYFGVDEFDPIDPRTFVDQFLELSSRWVICFCTTEQVGVYSNLAGKDRWIRGGWWYKPNGAPQRSGDRPAVPGEALAIMHPPGKKRWNGGGSKAFYRHNVARGDDRHHLTQKPVSLALELIEDYTEPGNTIWDPFAGLATFGVACVIRGRNYIGCEKNPEYATMATERLEAIEFGLTRADHKAGQVRLLERIGKGDG